MAVKPGEVPMSLVGKWRVVGVCALALLAPGPASAREPKLDLKAEWITPACEFPARFRVTVLNTGEEAFAVPLEQTLGYARPINFVATLKEGVFAFNGEGQFSSEYFFGPPYRLADLVDLDPDESQVFELEFDGIFDAHGGVRPTYEGHWQGRFAFYYFLPQRFIEGAGEHSPPILSTANTVSAWSNNLDCA